MTYTIENIRRQNFIDSESYANTLIEINEGKNQYLDGLADPNITADGVVASWGMLASYELWIFQLKFTAGEPLDALANSLDMVIQAYENWAGELKKRPNVYGLAVFNIDQSMDDYVDYLNLLSAIISLRRADLLARAADLLADTHVYKQDAIIEDLLSFFIPDRPSAEYIYWGKPYEILIDVMDADSPRESAEKMKRYLKKWYPSMKGQASFWGKHEQIKLEYSPCRGYWALCAASLTYLYALDDSSYRDEIVYARDLVDYARALQVNLGANQFQLLQLRVIAGNPCTRTGYWFTLAKPDSRAKFPKGDTMPDVANSDYGLTIWQWADIQ